jgi:hypothetical protein
MRSFAWMMGFAALLALACQRPASLKSTTWIDTAANLKYTYVATGSPPRFTTGLLTPFFGPDGRQLQAVTLSNNVLWLEGRALPPSGPGKIWMWNRTNLVAVAIGPDWFTTNDQGMVVVPRLETIHGGIPLPWPPGPAPGATNF